MRKRFKLIIFLALLGAILWNVYWNQNIMMRTYTCQNSDIPESFKGYRIVQLTDIHSVRNAKQGELIYEKVLQEEPDIICITGDLVDSEYYKKNGIEGEKYTLWLLEEILKIAPVYMSLGNHEQKLMKKDYQFLQHTGITLLDNTYQHVTVNGFSALLGGMSSWDYEEFFDDFTHQKGFKILLCHHPERFEPLIKDTDIDMTLSGHTH